MKSKNDQDLKHYCFHLFMVTKPIREVIIEHLKKKGGYDDFSGIFSYVISRKSEISLNAKDERKTVRGIISKMKKTGVISKSGLGFKLN